MDDGVEGYGWEGLPPQFYSDAELREKVVLAYALPAMEPDPASNEITPELDAVLDDSQPIKLIVPYSNMKGEFESDLIHEYDECGFVAETHGDADLNDSSQVQFYRGSSATTEGTSIYLDVEQNMKSHFLLDRDPAPTPREHVAFKSGDRLPLHQDAPVAFSQNTPSIPSEITVCSGPDLFSLANQGVIVTGAARGLGLCIATSLLEAQCPHVYCLDILESPSASEWITATQTAKKTGGRITYRKLDITDEHAVAKVIGEIFENCDCDIKGFFGAAGIQQMIPALEYPVEQFRKMMDVNVTGTFLTIQAVAQQMKQRQIPGSIVMTASMSGSIANKGLTCLAYNTSKSALLQMARSAAAEWGQYGIRVNTLSPGYIRTAMTDDLLSTRPDLEEEWLRGSMLQRLSTPDEFRGPVIFLLSQAGSFMTGADLIVDGGHTAF